MKIVSIVGLVLLVIGSVFLMEEGKPSMNQSARLLGNLAHWDSKIKHNEKKELTFSNTQSWDPDFLPENLPKPRVLHDSWETIEMDPPPHNDSIETQHELDLLHSYEVARTPEQIQAIREEIDVAYLMFGSSTISDMSDPIRYPHTSAMLHTVYEESMYITMHFKKKFDRVRPHMLDRTLTTAIPVPGHPAYPSGHAVQSYLIAFILGDIRPEYREIYKRDAERITLNRVIAGLHYPSDAEAGIYLAEQLYERFRSTQWYKSELEKAKIEWGQ